MKYIILGFLLIPNICFAQIGTASYYTRESAIKEGTSGICANGKEMVNDSNYCASWFYPLGSRVLVTNLDNDSRTVCVVADRGPSKRLVRKGRIIDLSLGSFKKLANPKLGIINVDVEKI